jgi:hypothetical protein
MASSKTAVHSHGRAQTDATSVSKAGPEPRTAGMSPTTAGPGDDASGSLPELAAADESEPDAGLGFFAVFGFLGACWPSAAPAGLSFAPSAPGLRIWPSTPACTSLRFVGVEPGACRGWETMRRPSSDGHAAAAQFA